MSIVPLAPRNNNPALNDLDLAATDPFATPTVSPPELPAVPEPTAQRTSHPRIRQLNEHTRLAYGRLSHEQATYSYKSASVSSTGASSNMTPISSIDLEKSAARERDAESPKRHSRTSRDPEKATQSPARGSRDQYQRPHASRLAYLEDDDLDRELQEQNAVKILLFLSGPCIGLSFLNAIWTIISLLLTTMTQPVRLCARRPTFGQQLGGLVGPALNLQLKSIYTPLPPHADEDTTYRSGMLVAVMLLSPFLSMGIMLAAWVTAVYWISSAMVGDPAGQDKRDDGRETVMALRKWWERWLVRSMREEQT